MKQTIRAAEQYLNKVLVRNMFSRMARLRIGTPEVEATAQRVIGRKSPRQPAEVARILEKRLSGIEKEVKHLRYSWHQRSRQMKQCIGSAACRRFFEVEQSHRRLVWQRGVKRTDRKVAFAIKKVRENQNRATTVTKFYKVTDAELSREVPVDLSSNYEVYGNVQLTEAEKQCLSLGPKYMESPDLGIEDFEVEVELECVKSRMELVKREEVRKSVGTVTEEALLDYEKRDKESREIFNTVTGTLNMSKQRVTDAKYNIRSYPPRQAKTEDEMLIQVRRQMLMKSFKKVRGKRCDTKGRQKTSNMTTEQREGKIQLQRRVREHEIIITKTDKSDKFAVVEPEAYREAAKVHLKDKEIGWSEVKTVETLLTRHAMQMVKALKMGTVHGTQGQVDRVRQAYSSKGGRPGPIYFLVKDHKKVKEGEVIPPTRGVCSAKAGPGSRLSNLTSTILNRAADAAGAETECMSTEEAMRKILEANRAIKSRIEDDPAFRDEVKKLVILSMDVNALYPSLKKDQVCPVLYNMLLKLLNDGKLVLDNINWQEVGKYLAILLSETEQRELALLTAIPKRAIGEDGPGRKPGPAYWESDTVDKIENGTKVTIDKWKFSSKEPSEPQKKRMFAQMVVCAVQTSMSNHLYRFDGKVYKQEDGGPIGDELAQAVARIVMIWWDNEFLKLCNNVQLELMFFLRYVDDTNKAVIPPPLGTRFNEGKLVVKPELVEEDMSRERDQVVGDLLRTMADSISPMLRFEEDVCSNYTDKRLPILDLKVWVAESDTQTTIMHDFYKKPMASRATLRASTAFPTSQLRAIFVEEVLRRLRNCSPEASWEDRGKHLTDFALCLKSCGHSEHFRQVVFQKAVARFEKELANHTDGVADLYRSRAERQRQVQQRGGKATKDSWFRQRKEGVNAQKVTSILTVPYMAGEVLKNQAQKILEEYKPPQGLKTKVQVGGGTKLQHSLMKSDPFPRERCHREECPLSQEDKGCQDQCFQDHVNYSIKCVRCEEARLQFIQRASDTEGAESIPEHPPLFIYSGESARGCYERFSQHVAKYKSRSNFMWQHVSDVHGGVMGSNPQSDFFMCREAVDPDPIRRILRESVRICRLREEETKGNFKNGRVVVMNGKDEWFGVKLVQPTFIQE